MTAAVSFREGLVIACLIVGGLTAAGGLVCLFVGLYDHGHRWALPVGCAVGTVIAVVLLAWLIVAASDDDGTSGTHEWRGGAGPDTVCYFENRTELVGKVPTTQAYTVCRDPETDR